MSKADIRCGGSRRERMCAGDVETAVGIFGHAAACLAVLPVGVAEIGQPAGAAGGRCGAGGRGRLRAGPFVQDRLYTQTGIETRGGAAWQSTLSEME